MLQRPIQPCAIVVGLLLPVLCAACPCGADIIEVPIGGDIHAALDLAENYDIIQLEAGEYPLSAPLIPMGKYVTILGAVDGAGNPASILDGGDVTRLVECENSEIQLTVFENLVFTNGRAGYAGAMSNFGARPTITNCWFIGNSCTSDGGAILNNVSRPVLTGCRFEGNTARFTGGAICNYNSSDAELTNCIFIDNDARVGGGVANLATSDPTILGCEFLGNTAQRGAGLAARTGSAPRILGSVFADNVASEIGGGINSEDTSLPEVTGTSFCRNLAVDIAGNWTDAGGNCLEGDCPLCPGICPADLDQDGMVDGADLTRLLGAWGTDDDSADLDGNGAVDGADLAIVLGAWGGCS